jgi:hypothetical protein
MPAEGFTNNHLDSILDSVDDYLYPVNSFIGHHLSKKNYSYLKTLPKSSEIHLSRYNELSSTLSFTELAAGKNFADSFFNSEFLPYVFVGSKKLFKTLAFNSFLPSDYDNIMSYLVSNNYIKVIGQGAGSAIVFNTQKLDETFVVQNSDNSDSFQSSISSFINSFNLTKIDNQYLLNVIEEKDMYINSLLEQIQNLQIENYQVSQMTWR